MTSNDVTSRTDTAAISLLVSFAEPVHTAAGSVTPRPEGFVLEAGEKKPRTFAFADSAVRALRKLTRNLSVDTVK